MTNPPADAIIDLYQRHAEHWDVVRGRTLFEKAWLDRFIALLPAGAPVLDIGCGAGQPISAYLLAQGLHLTGVDSAPAMIARASACFPASTFHVADMRTLALGRTFAGVLAWDSFFHLSHEDQRRMFAVFQAHAAPGAALLFTSGPSHGEAIGTFQGETLYHASLDPEEYIALLDAQGFTVVEMVAEDATCAGHTVWLAQQHAETV